MAAAPGMTATRSCLCPRPGPGKGLGLTTATLLPQSLPPPGNLVITSAHQGGGEGALLGLGGRAGCPPPKFGQAPFVKRGAHSSLLEFPAPLLWPSSPGTSAQPGFLQSIFAGWELRSLPIILMVQRQINNICDQFFHISLSISLFYGQLVFVHNF